MKLRDNWRRSWWQKAIKTELKRGSNYPNVSGWARVLVEKQMVGLSSKAMGIVLKISWKIYYVENGPSAMEKGDGGV